MYYFRYSVSRSLHITPRLLPSTGYNSMWPLQLSRIVEMMQVRTRTTHLPLRFPDTEMAAKVDTLTLSSYNPGLQ